VVTEKYAKIEAALDRFQEAHFWIHMVEEYYHQADPFRWHLNAFLKAIKEVPQLITMALQNEDGFKIWFAPHKNHLNEDPLLKVLSKGRDFVVHRGTIRLASHGTIGITEGRGIKFGISMPVNPIEDSDTAMERYLFAAAKKGDFFGFLSEDKDSLPCVHRIWRLLEFDDDIVDVCAKAWLKTGETIEEVLRWMGETPPPLSLDCRHSTQHVQFKLYDRKELNARLAALKNNT
jgi:hypothetical protein